jgi:hypothetical protein
MENKEYIGHGTKHNEYDIIDVVLQMDKAEAYIYAYEGKRYLKFSVAARKQRSDYGATHTTYVRVKAEQPEVAAEPAPEKPKATRKRRAAKA